VHKGSRWISQYSAQYSNPRLNYNFYGITNQFFETSQNQDFFRAELEGLDVDYKLSRVWRFGLEWNAGLGLSSYKIQENLETRSTDELPQDVLDNQPQITASTGLRYNSYPDGILQTFGLDFRMNAGYLYTVRLSEFNAPFFETSIRMNQKIFRTDRIILEMRATYKALWGDFLFYNAATLGGGTYLRGFFDQRFAGHAALATSNDLNIHLFNWRTELLPFKVGIRGMYDYGRVWTDEIEAEEWHSSYGGGVYLSTLDALLLKIDLHFSEGGQRLLFGVKVDI